MKTPGWGNHQGMRNLAGLVIVVAARTAAATPCTVHVEHAPDDVRTVIESWVQKETRCGAPLEVRVVPTEGGLYLFARDEQGRVRERLVPDADGAGVLVASWMADDYVPPPRIDVDVKVEITDDPDDPPVAANSSPSSVMLAGVVGAGDGEGGSGLRGELDVLRFGAWNLGAAVTKTSAGMSLEAFGASGGMVAAVPTTDYRAIAYLARTIDLGRWRLRPAFGGGVVSTTAHIHFDDYPPIVTNRDMTRDIGMAEVSLGLTCDFGSGWGLAIEPILELFGDTTTMSEMTPTTGDTLEHLHRTLELELAIGVRHSL
jgi:hypothetical protein